MTKARILSYTDKLWARPGETVTVHASGEGVESITVDLVRLICGDDSPNGPGYREEETSVAQQTVNLVNQPVHAGSFIAADDSSALSALATFTLDITLWPTTPVGHEQAVMGVWDAKRQAGFLLSIGPEGAALTTGDGSGTVSRTATKGLLTAREWYRVTASHDAETGQVIVSQEPCNVDGRGESARQTSGTHETGPALHGDVPFLVGTAWGGLGNADGICPVMCFNGKVETPRVADTVADALSAADCLLAWDFSQSIKSLGVEDVSGNGCHGHTVNLPTRAMTGSNWTSDQHDWRHAQGEYGAIHLHDDDLGDAGWAPSVAVRLPDDLKSGVYCIRLSGGGTEDMPPVVVQPKQDGTKN
ncbi:MAG: N,N-dimethylformamidase beta subunit family domain-containing protein, partial [Alphaproteobacteria bacterium]